MRTSKSPLQRLTTTLALLLVFSLAPAQAADPPRGWGGFIFARAPATKTTPKGIVVVRVVPGSPADRGGLKPGDFIKTLNDVGLTDPKALNQYLMFAPPDSPLTFVVLREGKETTVKFNTVVWVLKDRVHRALTHGAAYLLKARLKDGHWPNFRAGQKGGHAASTALAFATLADLPAAVRKVHENELKDTADLLIGLMDKRGAIVPQVEDVTKYINYATALTLIGLKRSGLKGYEDTRKRLADFLRKRQLHDGFKVHPVNHRFGGWDHYDDNHPNTMRTDSSITAFVLEALGDTRSPENSLAFKRARRFLSRCQNLPEHPDEEKPDPNMDGGFIFTPLQSKAGYTPARGDEKNLALRSYGSTTVDGLRSLLNIGLAPEAPAVQAALGWLANNARVDYNPGFPANAPIPFERGLHFYYQHGLARALWGLERRGHRPTADRLQDWPDRLGKWLVNSQEKAGFWKNESDLMNEDDPVLATCFSLRALSCVEWARSAREEKP
ncbi:PDZ domain-containing protein [bacterium AH-315-F18]|nr:PDZ domain-containing protein [bacterium AH-315-F18]